MFVALSPGKIPIDGEVIRRMRERKFVWTRRELGERTGLSPQAIQKIETTPGHRVTPSTFKKLADAFGLGTDEAKASLSPNAEWDESFAPCDDEKPVADPTAGFIELLREGAFTPEQLRIIAAEVSRKLAPVQGLKIAASDKSVRPPGRPKRS